MRQRLILLLAAIVGVWGILRIQANLAPADLSSGYTLLSAQRGLPAALGALVMGSLPAVVMGCVASITGHPLGGPFVLSLSLTALAIAGGSSEGWLRRSDLGSAYAGLLLETVVWSILVAVAVGAMMQVRWTVLRRWPKLSDQQETAVKPVWAGLEDGWSILAGGICAVIGGILTRFLVTTAQIGQVIGGVMGAFLLAGLAAGVLLPKARTWTYALLSPAVTALAGYGWMLWQFDQSEAVLQAWFRGRLPGLALVLPIHYMSAGVLGVVLGLAWAHGLKKSRESTSPETGAGASTAAVPRESRG